jgi:hypothetical protein
VRVEVQFSLSLVIEKRRKKKEEILAPVFSCFLVVNAHLSSYKKNVDFIYLQLMLYCPSAVNKPKLNNQFC